MRHFPFLSALFCCVFLFASCSQDSERPAEQRQAAKALSPGKRPASVSLVERAEASEIAPASDVAHTLNNSDNDRNTDTTSAAEVTEIKNIKSFEGTIKGRAIHIAVTGVDSRVGDRTPHADGNHVLSIYPDSGKIVITSVPRDTPAEAGFTADSMQRFNILANVLPNRSRKSYHSELARIAGVPRIDYYMEVGFSQAMGVMELLGYKNPKNTLRVLRSRKGLGGDDFQRCYNQGQFIRQAILRHFGKLDGFLGGMAVRGGLLLLNTDLTADKANSIIEVLSEKNFADSPDDVLVRIRPKMHQNFTVYSFDQNTIDSLDKKIDKFNNYMKKKDSSFALKGTSDIDARLANMLALAAKDTASRPRNVISRLERSFEQHVWLQVSDPTRRHDIRSKFAQYLTTAYRKIGKESAAQNVQTIVKTEEELFKAQQQ